MITADYEMVPDDHFHLRAAMIEGFRRRGIYPHGVSSLAEESLLWEADPDLPPLPTDALGQLTVGASAFARHDSPFHGDAERRRELSKIKKELAKGVHRYASKNAVELGVDPQKKLGVAGFHSVFRVAPDGQLKIELVAQIVQTDDSRKDQLGAQRDRQRRAEEHAADAVQVVLGSSPPSRPSVSPPSARPSVRRCQPPRSPLSVVQATDRGKETILAVAPHTIRGKSGVKTVSVPRRTEMQTQTLALQRPRRRRTPLASDCRSRTACSGSTGQDRIGSYLILDVIGCGSFSIVHEAYGPVGDRRLAVKLCDRQDREARARFRREAAIGRYLDHPNLTEVLDLGSDGSTLYLVQEYLSGRDLADLIRGGQPSRLSDKIDILVQVASGLAHAHSKGVLHRDIKPSNIRVLDDGQVKIMDFGSAKRPTIDTVLTQIGTILGTLAYMPPECLSGQAPQASSDVYAFGTVAYELLSFRRPFDADRLLSLLHQIQTTAPPPLTEIQPDCPSELAEIIHCCLNKAPEERPDFATLESDLKRLQARLGLHAFSSSIALRQ